MPQPNTGLFFTTPGERHSLFGEILDWLLVPLLILWPLSVALTWLAAQAIANRPYDRELAETARALVRQVQVREPQGGKPTDVRLRLPEFAVKLLRSDDVDRIYFQVLGARGERVAGDAELPVPEGMPAAAQEVHFRDDEVRGEPVRVAYLWLPSSGVAGESPPLVQVAETLNKRQTLATEIVTGVIAPEFIIFPVAVFLVWLALARSLKPLDELQHRIRQRESQDLSPIDERDAPEEVAPLVQAINDLLARLDTSMGAQKHFLADAAHQLKTPLAGLRMQAELAAREIDAGQQDPDTMKRSLQQIAHSSQRAAHMVNQLLAMARAEDKEIALRAQDVGLARLARETVRDFVPLALDRGIDLGYEGPERDEPPGKLRGQPLLVRELIRNLVDNALQYTPRGGAVTVRVTGDPFGQVIVLQVEDTGPGIPAAERELVFLPFYRVPDAEVEGSGLGLAIVREIAQSHHAQVQVTDARARGAGAAPGQGPGTLITVRFALAATPSAPPAAAGRN